MNLLSSMLGKVSTKWKTLTEWLAVYEDIISQRGYDRQTITNHKANIKHVRRIWGHHTLRSIKPHHISTGLREFLPDRSSTAQRVLFSIRDAFAEAVANDWIDTNPATHVKQPSHKVKRKRLTLEVWQGLRVIASSSKQKWLEPMSLLALLTGQRRADVAKMRFCDIPDGYLHIEQQKQAGKGYGARVAIPLALRLDVVGMSLADVVELCRTYAKEGEYLLRKNDGGPIELSSLSTRFNELIRKHLGAKFYRDREWPSFHEQRSLAARTYKEQGVDTQTLLGHKHAEMTAMYEDDRGLSAGAYKMLALPVPT